MQCGLQVSRWLAGAISTNLQQTSISKIRLRSIVNAQGFASLVVAGALLLCAAPSRGTTLSIHGPPVNTNDFRITTFASGLNYPLGMARLADGSLLVTVSDGTGFFNSTG